MLTHDTPEQMEQVELNHSATEYDLSPINETLKINSIVASGDTSLLISWEDTDGGRVKVAMSSTPINSFHTDVNIYATNIGETSLLLTGLTPSTEYYFRIIEEASKAVSPYQAAATGDTPNVLKNIEYFTIQLSEQADIDSGIILEEINSSIRSGSLIEVIKPGASTEMRVITSIDNDIATTRPAIPSDIYEELNITIAKRRTQAELQPSHSYNSAYSHIPPVGVAARSSTTTNEELNCNIHPSSIKNTIENSEDINLQNSDFMGTVLSLKKKGNQPHRLGTFDYSIDIDLPALLEVKVSDNRSDIKIFTGANGNLSASTTIELENDSEWNAFEQDDSVSMPFNGVYIDLTLKKVLMNKIDNLTESKFLSKIDFLPTLYTSLNASAKFETKGELVVKAEREISTFIYGRLYGTTAEELVKSSQVKIWDCSMGEVNLEKLTIDKKTISVNPIELGIFLELKAGEIAKGYAGVHSHINANIDLNAVHSASLDYSQYLRYIAKLNSSNEGPVIPVNSMDVNASVKAVSGGEISIDTIFTPPFSSEKHVDSDSFDLNLFGTPKKFSPSINIKEKQSASITSNSTPFKTDIGYSVDINNDSFRVFEFKDGNVKLLSLTDINRENVSNNLFVLANTTVIPVQMLRRLEVHLPDDNELPDPDPVAYCNSNPIFFDKVIRAESLPSGLCRMYISGNVTSIPELTQAPLNTLNKAYIDHSWSGDSWLPLFASANHSNYGDRILSVEISNGLLNGRFQRWGYSWTKSPQKIFDAEYTNGALIQGQQSFLKTGGVNGRRTIDGSRVHYIPVYASTDKEYEGSIETNPLFDPREISGKESQQFIRSGTWIYRHRYGSTISTHTYNQNVRTVTTNSSEVITTLKSASSKFYYPGFYRSKYEPCEPKTVEGYLLKKSEVNGEEVVTKKKSYILNYHGEIEDGDCKFVLDGSAQRWDETGNIIEDNFYIMGIRQ